MDLWQTIESAAFHRHSHANPYAAVVLRGGYEEAGDSGRFFVSEGDVLLHHSFEAHLNRSFSNKVVVLNLPLPRLPIEAAGGWRVGHALDEICRAAERSQRDAAALLLSLSLDRGSSKLDWPDLLSGALRRNRTVRLGEWASAHYLSPWSLSRGFRQVFGITPEAFRVRAKTHRAFQMILKSEMPLSTIAAEMGFSDQAHMSRSIKALSGESPRQWPMLKVAKGHLIMIGGGTARTPERHLSLVSAVNGGIAALSKSIAEQGLQDSVHVNLIQPGTIQTSRRKKLMEKLAGQEGIDYAEYLLDSTRRLKITRLGEPADVAEAVAFLATEEARWIHGAIIDVDGGQNKGV